jgi:hypothetical protein
VQNKIASTVPTSTPAPGIRKTRFRWFREKRGHLNTGVFFSYHNLLDIYLRVSATFLALRESPLSLETNPRDSHSPYLSQGVCRPPRQDEPESWSSYTQSVLLNSK